jgi:hypothetical protein
MPEETTPVSLSDEIVKLSNEEAEAIIQAKKAEEAKITVHPKIWEIMQNMERRKANAQKKGGKKKKRR